MENYTKNKSVEFYLSKGFDKSAAEYFASGRKKIIKAVANDDFTLTLSFDNGKKRLYNAAAILQKGTVFEPFMDLKNFKRVYVDENHCVAWDIDPDIDSSISWNNKVDLCPDSCYIDSVPIQDKN